MPIIRSRAGQITIVSIAFLAGIVLGRFGMVLDWPAAVPFVLAGLIAGLKKRLALAVVASVAAFMILGMWRGWATEFNHSYLAQHIDQKVVLTGVITDDPGFDDYGNNVFNLGDVELNGAPIKQTVKIKTFNTALMRGYKVRVEGKLRPALGVVRAQVSYTQVVVLDDKIDWLERVRQRFFAGIRTVIPAPMNGFGLGLLVGARSLIPAELEDDMSITGLSHLVAASGYNLTVLVMAMQRMLLPVSYFSATAAGLWLIGVFIVVSGFSAAVFRAAVVSSIGILTSYYGYKVHPFTLLSLPAMVTVAWNPDYLTHDLGWQLSFTAFYGVLVLAPLVERRWVKRPTVIKSLFIESVSAHVMTAPLIMWRFESVSIVAPIANIFVVPLIPLAMLLTFLTGLAGAMFPWGAGGLIAWPTIGLLSLCVAAAQWFANLPLSSADLRVNDQMAAVFYAGIIVLSLLLSRGIKGLEVRDSLLAGTVSPVRYR